MKIETLMKNKKVLMIPVYSSRSYITNEYDLATDGNVSKYLTKIINSNAKKVDILFPTNSINTSFVYNITKKLNTKVKWIPTIYGGNAHETRNMGNEFVNIIKGLTQINSYDLIITEIDMLAYLVATNNYDFCKKENFVYWAGTHNADGTPWYEEGHNEINKIIAKNIITACLFEGQVDFYGGQTFYDEYIYDPSLYEKKTIFFPYRLSDKSYKLDLFKSTISKLLKNGINNFVVLYTDPNESKLLDDEDKTIYIKVPSNKYVYLSILKGKPIIPFFDDLTKNSHSNIFEFKYYDCDIITDYENFYQILLNKLED